MKLTKKGAEVIDSLYEIDQKYGIRRGRLDRLKFLCHLQEYMKLKDKEENSEVMSNETKKSI